MKLINADLVVHWEAYDDEHESFTRHSGTIAEFLDQMTDEGCPETVDAVPVVHGEWILHHDVFGEPVAECSRCKVQGIILGNFCPNCGADMRKDGDDGKTD